jgi:para-aminobenzoate synthetase
VPTHSSPYPDAALIFTDRAVVVDHDQKCVYLIGVRPADTPPGSS